MDPYDSSSTLTVTDCLPYWGRDSFNDEFLTELSEQDSELPLDEMCEGRGYASLEDFVWLTDLKLTQTEPPIIEGDFRVQFSGTMPTGCKDASGKFKVDKRLLFKLNLDTGEVEFERPQEYTDYGH